MKSEDLKQLGVPNGDAMERAHEFIVAFRESGGDMSQIAQEIGAIVGEPARFLDDPMRAALARALYVPAFKQRETLAPWQQWGTAWKRKR